MQPLVHKWLRERPQLSVVEEALECQTAMAVLWQAISMLGNDGEGEMAMHRDMKPHVNHCLGADQAQECARFGKVYPKCGAFSDAEVLLRQVQDHVVFSPRSRPQHTRCFKEARAGSLWYLTWSNDAAELLHEVYDS
ncbi:uncharacterized protein BCR38DRAFT_471557 [Pseudomassariella vexata]|uniref:Uncharacterized protein n=1 Tax=Pseudomassariella vexata TaxID=1141098 RepID=A0A1Y2EF55_9PEZI|nr:uncharacterized protein BCR38DRAFT_471557 [Pseudomassariella vexata]ORY70211.1 hypothetical protein BCR38DRAFT_471557 [Pseudomassariella vexata]